MQSKYATFWAFVLRRGADECWPWQGPVNHDGYGQFSEYQDGKQTTIRAHRRAYELTHGPVPPRLSVRHICDNPPCCNPAHLVPGTHAENVRDAVARDRHVGGRQRIFRATAIEIVRRVQQGERQLDVAAIYGLDPSTISHIVNGRRHARHVAEAMKETLDGDRSTRSQTV